MPQSTEPSSQELVSKGKQFLDVLRTISGQGVRLRSETKMMSWDGANILEKELDLFKFKQFESEIILLTIRWYLKYGLCYSNLVEMMEERGLHMAHTTIMEGTEKVHFFKNNKIAVKNEPLESLLRLVLHLGRHH